MALTKKENFISSMCGTDQPLTMKRFVGVTNLTQDRKENEMTQYEKRKQLEAQLAVYKYICCAVLGFIVGYLVG